MVYNLKAGLMATTTMVGSAVAFTKTQAGREHQKETNQRGQMSGQRKTEQHANLSPDNDVEVLRIWN